LPAFVLLPFLGSVPGELARDAVENTAIGSILPAAVKDRDVFGLNQLGLFSITFDRRGRKHSRRFALDAPTLVRIGIHVYRSSIFRLFTRPEDLPPLVLRGSEQGFRRVAQIQICA